MRIISGSARGRRLITPPGKSLTIRPTSDRAKEALFSILQSRLKNASVLDLFAGTGALGLEALSRGAARAVFIDNSSSAIALIERNIQLCGFSGDESILAIKHDLRDGFPRSVLGMQKKGGYDLIFLDPPYSKGLADTLLGIIAKNRILAGGGLVVVEERSSERLPHEVDGLQLADQRKYGDTGFWMYSHLLIETEFQSEI